MHVKPQRTPYLLIESGLDGVTSTDPLDPNGELDAEAMNLMAPADIKSAVRRAASSGGSSGISACRSRSPRRVPRDDHGEGDEVLRAEAVSSQCTIHKLLSDLHPCEAGAVGKEDMIGIVSCALYPSREVCSGVTGNLKAPRRLTRARTGPEFLLNSHGPNGADLAGLGPWVGGITSKLDRGYE